MFPQAEHPLEQRGGRLILHVRATPKASRSRVGGAQADVSGRYRLKVAVTAPPADGKANAAVLKAVSRAIGVPPARLAIVAGETGRNKQIEIIPDGEPDGLAPEAGLAALIEDLAASGK